MTAHNTSYPPQVELTNRMLCRDGQYRSDCVVQINTSGGMLDLEKGMCGQPIVGIIHAGDFMGDIRMCKEHLDSFSQHIVPPGTPPDGRGKAYADWMRAKADKARREHGG